MHIAQQFFHFASSEPQECEGVLNRNPVNPGRGLRSQAGLPNERPTVLVSMKNLASALDKGNETPDSSQLLFVTPPSASTPPTGEQHTPIEAYCIPFRNDSDTGCYLKVASAKPGASLLFRLESTVGEELHAGMQLEADSSHGGQYVVLKDSELYQANLTGTVEYRDDPSTQWDVPAWDPSAAHYYSFHAPRVVRGFLWDGYTADVHTDHHTTVRLYYWVLRGKAPAPPPPPVRTHIKAACLAATVLGQGTGCLLRVSDADTGATVLFRLRSANGTEVTPTLQLAPGTTYGSRMYLMENAVEHQAQLGGTAEYLGQPETAVGVVTWDKWAAYQVLNRPMLFGEYQQYEDACHSLYA
ncbi:hypothetical protein QBZ16_003708 [Prototheca wickerhamii]|uniref:Uncharacterized protein n=1 Tax=Prototheca wickerhamii TaxID=3111 RepID=A0AAD9IG95_PROWI|nr:hypothetical protein QBZ16_003708 [Prototheca wickerhamii]